jgi:hypothetical protein
MSKKAGSERSMFVSSPIDPDTWNEAGWRGVAYLYYPEGQALPGMGLLFDKLAPGRKIFTDWRAKFGSNDRTEALRIAIVEGDVPGFEPGYFVHIGFDPEQVRVRAREQGLDDRQNPVMMMVSRVHRMTPPVNSPNLADFKREFAKYGRYVLLPVIFVDGQPTPQYDLSIEKTKIHFRTAAEIGDNDIDSACFGKAWRRG